MKRLRRSSSWLFFGLVTCAAPAVAQSQGQNPPPPTITSVAPATVTRGDTISITGSNLFRSGLRTVVRVDGVEMLAQVASPKDTLIRAVVGAPGGQLVRAGEYDRQLSVQVGDVASNSYAIRQLTWGVVRQVRVLVPSVAYLVLVVVIMFGWRTGSVILSETGQFSLSKLQMSIWTFVFGLAYVMLAATWGQFLDITEGMFWLMGVSATTAVGAKAIVLKNLANLDPNKPSGLLRDYDKTADKYRLSLHRCQIAAWTLIVLSIFVIKVATTMHLPDIPKNLLVLMGISGGTYLGFNYPTPPKNPPPPNP